MTGGVSGLKDKFDIGTSRLQSFGKFILNDLDKYPIVKDLFESNKFQDAAKSVCPEDSQVIDPFQFNMIVQLPGNDNCFF